MGTPGPSIMLPEGLKDLEGPRPAGTRRFSEVLSRKSTPKRREEREERRERREEREEREERRDFKKFENDFKFLK